MLGMIVGVTNRFDAPMRKIKAKAMEYLPKEFIDIAEAFMMLCGRRAGTYDRIGWMYLDLESQ